METERKTLTMKTKRIEMWQKASPIEEIEKNLKAAVKSILDAYTYDPSASYDVTYRLNKITRQKLSDCAVTAYDELRKNIKFATESRRKFERITANIVETLLPEVGKEKLMRFEEVLYNMLHPKEVLPKVSLNLR